MSSELAVGVIANPAAGRDIRRLVAGASVFDNAEKGSMALRLMVGLGSAGVDRVLMMPTVDGVSARLVRALEGRTGELAAQAMPTLEFLDMAARGTAQDTAEAAMLMVERGVAAIAVLGGDGTNRIVARHCQDIPLCTLATGTNNAFPAFREATIAGLATGLVAARLIPRDEALRREKLLRLALNGNLFHDCALVDVAVCESRWIGARAIWRIGDISEFFVTFASPAAVGLCAIAGLVEPVPRDASYGLHVRLADPAEASTVIRAPLAPGLVVPVGIEDVQRIERGTMFRISPGLQCLALDGERELELGPEDRVDVRLCQGPLTIDVENVMVEAGRRGILSEARYASTLERTGREMIL